MIVEIIISFNNEKGLDVKIVKNLVAYTFAQYRLSYQAEHKRRWGHCTDEQLEDNVMKFATTAGKLVSEFLQDIYDPGLLLIPEMDFMLRRGLRKSVELESIKGWKI